MDSLDDRTIKNVIAPEPIQPQEPFKLSHMGMNPYQNQSDKNISKIDVDNLPITESKIVINIDEENEGKVPQFELDNQLIGEQNIILPQNIQMSIAIQPQLQSQLVSNDNTTSNLNLDENKGIAIDQRPKEDLPFIKDSPSAQNNLNAIKDYQLQKEYDDQDSANSDDINRLAEEYENKELEERKKLYSNQDSNINEIKQDNNNQKKNLYRNETPKQDEIKEMLNPHEDSNDFRLFASAAQSVLNPEGQPNLINNQQQPASTFNIISSMNQQSQPQQTKPLYFGQELKQQEHQHQFQQNNINQPYPLNSPVSIEDKSKTQPQLNQESDQVPLYNQKPSNPQLQYPIGNIYQHQTSLQQQQLLGQNYITSPEFVQNTQQNYQQQFPQYYNQNQAFNNNNINQAEEYGQHANLFHQSSDVSNLGYINPSQNSQVNNLEMGYNHQMAYGLQQTGYNNQMAYGLSTNVNQEIGYGQPIGYNQQIGNNQPQQYNQIDLNTYTQGSYKP